MYLLFECGICSSPYQIQVEKFSNSLQKVVCPSCQSFHYFGTAQDIEGVTEPTIEKLMVQNSKIPSLDPKFEQRSISQEVFWRCGVCETSYHFNLDRVTSNGIKVTCNTCFNFFILQKVGIMVDMDHMIMQDIGGTADKIPSTQISNAEKRGILPPMIEESEVSGKFDLHTLQERLKKIETVETLEDLSDEIEVVEPTVITPIPTNVESMLDEITKTAAAPQPKPPTPSPAKPIPTSPAHKPLPAMAQSNPGVKLPPPPTIAKPSVTSEKTLVVKDADQAWVDSFKSFNSQKREFKLDKKYEISSVTFVEPSAQRKKKSFMEENMVKASIWISGVSVFCLLVVFGYDWYETHHKKPVVPVHQTEETAPTDNTKPRYGFPEMSESPDAPTPPN